MDGIGIEPIPQDFQSHVHTKYTTRPKQMVGRDGLEPPTFRVSAEGSNQLSYLPMESEAGIEPALLRFCRPHPSPVLGTRPMVPVLRVSTPLPPLVCDSLVIGQTYGF